MTRFRNQTQSKPAMHYIELVLSGYIRQNYAVEGDLALMKEYVTIV